MRGSVRCYWGAPQRASRAQIELEWQPTALGDGFIEGRVPQPRDPPLRSLLVDSAGDSGLWVGGQFGAWWIDYDLDFAPDGSGGQRLRGSWSSRAGGGGVCGGAGGQESRLRDSVRRWRWVVRRVKRPSRTGRVQDCVAATYCSAASTIETSWSTVPPLTPMPAITAPSLLSGTPPPMAQYLPPETVASA